MVRFEKLVVQGFKSFKRKVSIPLSPGVSVFTGPNGSGKSCIADSILFVIGLSSSRVLRAKKSQDLIFHGSKSKTGSDFAHVTLYIDNSKKEIPINERIVTVSRKINTKGVSTYRLNGKVVPRQQVIDILSMVGIRSNGHNIIQQGEVTQIVEMDAVERREIIDEISGIMEFDDKKAKAEKELAKIEAKVKEASIILEQKSEVMKKLSKEREAAMKYKELEKTIADVKIASVYQKFSECEEGLEGIVKRLESKTKELEKVEEEIKKMDDEIDNEEKKIEEVTKKVMKMSDRLEVTKKITRLRSEIEMKQEKIESNTKQIQRINDFLEKMKGNERISPALKQIMELNGVFGKVSTLVSVPAKYSVAIEVAAGSRMNDVVVDTVDTAVKCIKYLKKTRGGRARFIPLDRISSHTISPPPGTKLLSDIVSFDRKYINAMNYVFGTTTCAENIDAAKRIAKINRVRIVTLDGDLIESSGAMTGGSYKSKKSFAEFEKYAEDRKRLQKEIEELETGIIKINKKLEELAGEEKDTETVKIETKMLKKDEKLRKTRENRKALYEKRLILQQEIGKYNIRKAKYEAEFDNSKVQLEGLDEENNAKELKKKISKEMLKKSSSELRIIEKNALAKLKNLGPVNLKALDDFDNLKDEFDDFKEKVGKIVSERESIMNVIKKIETRRSETFNKTLDEINKNFKTTYKELTGGYANLELENGDINGGLLIKAQPPGKKLLNMDSLSGGEKTLAAFAFLFAVQRYKPSPFYILDEADAALDQRNIKRIAGLIKNQSKYAQFIVVSHNDHLVREADQIYGVTMEDGESKIMGIELPKTQENN